MTTASQPVVARIVVREEPDTDSDPYDFRTRFHWERFGREVEVDDSEYQYPFGTRGKFEFDDERHPIYRLQPGARLVIDSSDQVDKNDNRPVAERLAQLVEDAKHIRTWQQDEWQYIGIIVTATVSVTITTETGYSHVFTDTESTSLWGIQSGINYSDERTYYAEIIQELTDELKSTRII